MKRLVAELVEEGRLRSRTSIYGAPILLIMLITNNRHIMGNRVNGRAMNVVGWITTGTIFAATIALVVTWIV